MFCLNNQYHCMAIKNEHLCERTFSTFRKTHTRSIYIYGSMMAFFFRYCCSSLNFRFTMYLFFPGHKKDCDLNYCVSLWCLHFVSYRRWFVLLLCFNSQFHLSTSFPQVAMHLPLYVQINERVLQKVFWFDFKKPTAKVEHDTVHKQ